jgi:hypothetical protein
MALYKKELKILKTKFIPTANQKKYLIDQPILALENAKRTNDTRVMITRAPTGQGKSTATVNAMLPKYLTRNQDTELVFVVCFDSAVCAELHKNIRKSMKVHYFGERSITVMDKDDLEKERQGKEKVNNNDIVIVVCTTHTFSNIYNTDSIDNSSFLTPDLVIIDEVHREMACTDIDDTIFDFGTLYGNFEPKRLGVMLDLAKVHGTLVYGMTGTPSQSQLGQTDSGKLEFNLVSDMPKNELENKTTYYHIVESGNLKTTLNEALASYDSVYNSVINDINSISEGTWDQLSKGGIFKLAPRMIIKTAQSNAKEDRGMTMDDAIDYVRPLAQQTKADFIVYSSEKKGEYTYWDKDGLYSTTVSNQSLDQLIDKANERVSLLRPTYMILLNAGNVGINVTGLSVVAYLAKPSQDLVQRTQLQFMARSNRMPFGPRDHETQALLLKGIKNSSSDERFIMTEYVAKMVVSAVFVPGESKNLERAIDAYTENTMSHLKGRDFYHDRVNATFNPETGEVDFDSTPMLRQKWVFDQGDVNKIARKSYCETCKSAGYDGFCFDVERLFHTLNKNGIEVSREEFKLVNLLQVDHSNGNRTDNGSNQITTCPVYHQAKTKLSGDCYNRYDRITGMKI